MTAFAGLVAFDEAMLDSRLEQAVIAAAAGPRRQAAACSRMAGAVIAQRLPEPAAYRAAARPAPDVSHERSCLFAADVRLDNRAELTALLGGPDQSSRNTDTDLLRDVADRLGDAGIARCLGAFAFALWRPQQRRLLLGRDCLGNRALFYHRGRGFVAFASTLGGLLALPQVPRELDEVALANFLAVNLTARAQTFYRGIARVPTRCIVEFGPGAAIERQYWSALEAAPAPALRDDDYVAEARGHFDRAVTDATADLPRIALACSGGLDSSAIAATLARLGRAEAVTCYSVVPPADARIDAGAKHYLDETDKLHALQRRHPGLTLHLLTPQTLHPYESDPTRYFVRAHMPLYAPTLLGARGALYDTVAAAYPALIGGYAGNFSLTWSGRFSTRTLLQDGRLREFAHEIAAIAQRNGHGIARTLMSEVVMPGAPLWGRRLLHRLRGRDPDDVAAYSALNPAFIADHDLPRQWHDDAFEAWPVAGGWNAARFRARVLFDLNQMGRDARAASADVFGYEIRDPFADRRLIEFALNVPERLYRRDGVPRAFARAVFADRLPPEILNEQRRGLSTATWFRRLDMRRADIEAEVERLEASTTAQRLIDIPRLKGLLQRWPADEAAAQKDGAIYHGTLTRALHVGRFIRWVESANA